MYVERESERERGYMGRRFKNIRSVESKILKLLRENHKLSCEVRPEFRISVSLAYSPLMGVFTFSPMRRRRWPDEWTRSTKTISRRTIAATEGFFKTASASWDPSVPRRVVTRWDVNFQNGSRFIWVTIGVQ